MSDSLKEALVERAPLSPTAALAGRFEMAAMPGVGLAAKASEQARQGFRVGELRFLIRYEAASELTELPDIHRLPNAPVWFLGIANLHGKLVPVFDLAAYAGIAPDRETRRMLLVLAHGNDATGVLIDGIPERLRLMSGAESDVAAAPERLRPHLHHICQIKEQLWLDLDTRSLLGALEQSLETHY
jgi:chemotaxis signal transduction protein